MPDMLVRVSIRDWIRTSHPLWPLADLPTLGRAFEGLRLQVAVLLPIMAVALHIRGFGPVQEKLARLADCSPRPAGHTRPQVDVASVPAFVELAVSKGAVGANYLGRSLVLWFLLRRKGIGSDLRVGVRGPSGEEPSMCHAWIENEARVIFDSSDVADRYRPFRPSIMRRRAWFD
jgi:hypothetical protein